MVNQPVEKMIDQHWSSRWFGDPITSELGVFRESLSVNLLQDKSIHVGITWYNYNKPAVWEWQTYQLSMVMTEGWFIFVIPPQKDKHSPPSDPHRTAAVDTCHRRRRSREWPAHCERSWGFQKWGYPKNGWSMREHPIKLDDLGVPLFQETIILGSGSENKTVLESPLHNQKKSLPTHRRIGREWWQQTLDCQNAFCLVTCFEGCAMLHTSAVSFGSANRSRSAEVCCIS